MLREEPRRATPRGVLSSSRHFVSLIAMLVLVGSGEAWQGPPPLPAPVEAGGPVRIDGSNGLLPLASALRDAWRVHSPEIDVALGAGLGGRARLDALANGDIDIALASQGLDVSDLAKRGMTANLVAVTPVVFGVHADLTVLDLKAEDICGIYSGKAATWAAFGGPAIAIRPFLRTETDIDTEVVRARIPCMKDLVPGPTVSVARTTGDMLVALQNSPGAIGLSTTTAVRQSIVALRALSFASVAPTPENVLNGRYPLVRPAYLITMNQPPPSARRFIAFLRSERGAEAILAAGALPAPSDSSSR